MFAPYILAAIALFSVLVYGAWAIFDKFRR